MIQNDCNTCLSVTGKKPYAEGLQIYSGQHWTVEHAFGVPIIGWMVIVLKRHAEALHELTTEELQELGMLQTKAARVLHKVLNSTKEYFACFAEAEGFTHLHIHCIAKPSDLENTYKGSKIFLLLKEVRDGTRPAVDEVSVRKFVQSVKEGFCE